jgi:hypothetical protein
MEPTDKAADPIRGLEDRIRVLENYLALAKLVAGGFGVTAVALTGFLIYIFSYVNDLKSDIKTRADALKADFASAKADIDKAGQEQMARLRSSIKVDSHRKELSKSETWDQSFDFNVVAAWVIPIGNFDNIENIGPVVRSEDQKTVSFTVNKKSKSPSPATVRIVAIGF